jgi:hypothetical protein
MKRIYAKVAAAMFAALMLYSCTKVYTRDDLDRMSDKTFYLLPVESTFMVPASIDTWQKVEEKIGISVVKGVKELDVQKFKESIEKRYGIIVDISYFEKARTDAVESIKYFRALKDANASGSSSFTSILSSGYNGYLDSGLYTEIEEIKKTKPCIIISHDTSVNEKDIKTNIKVILLTNDENKGTITLTRSMWWTAHRSGDVFDTNSVKYDEIYKALSRITEYRYTNYSGWGLSGGSDSFLDGTM